MEHETATHLCSGIDCPVCIEREKEEAENRYRTVGQRAKKFSARKRRVSAVTVAANQVEEAPPESNSVCAVCGCDAVGFKSLCCEAAVIRPSEYTERNERTVIMTHRKTGKWFRLEFTAGRGYIQSFNTDGSEDSPKVETSTTALRSVLLGRAEFVCKEVSPEEVADATWKAYDDRYGVSPAPQSLNFDGGDPAAPGNITDADAALRFMLAGNAYFTLRSKKTGERYTYRVNVPPDDKSGALYGKKYFVALLSGPDNTADYTYLGMIQDNVFRLTRASKMNADSKPVAAIRWTLERLQQRHFPSTVEFWHEGRCGRCGRKLTVPESVAAGIGPECAGKVGL